MKEHHNNLSELQKHYQDMLSAYDSLKANKKQIKILFTKHKKLFSTKYEGVDLQEPVMFFIRRSGDVELYEKVTVGKFQFKHSDGENRYILVTPARQNYLSFLQKKIRCYFAHEDYAVTGWPDPIITTQEMNIEIEKSLADMRKFKAEEVKAWSGLAKIGMWTIGIVVLGLLLYIVLKPQNISQPNIIIQGGMGLLNSTIGG